MFSLCVLIVISNLNLVFKCFYMLLRQMQYFIIVMQFKNWLAENSGIIFAQNGDRRLLDVQRDAQLCGRILTFRTSILTKFCHSWLCFNDFGNSWMRDTTLFIIATFFYIFTIKGKMIAYETLRLCWRLWDIAESLRGNVLKKLQCQRGFTKFVILTKQLGQEDQQNLMATT